MVEIWGDSPIRMHCLGWCHIRWPLRNWKMMFPRVWVFWWNMLLGSPEGKVFVGVFLDWSVFWLHEGVSRPAEHEHTYASRKSTFSPLWCLPYWSYSGFLVGTVGNYNSWCAIPARIDWTFQPEWFEDSKKPALPENREIAKGNCEGLG